VIARATYLWTAAAGLVVAASVLVFTRALGTRTNYDEGVYLASLDALRRGLELGGDVYTSQPPGFYWVMRLLAAPFGNSIEGIRVGFVILAVIGVIAAITLGWRLCGPAAGLVAGALVTIGPPYPSVAPTVAADVPSVALGLVSLAVLAIAVKSRRPLWWSVVAGAILAVAIATKLLAAPFVVPFLALVLAARAARRLLPAAAAGAAAVVTILTLVHIRSLGAIWDAVVGDHTGAKELGSIRENATWIRDLLEPRTPIAWLVPAGFVAFLVSRSARRTWPLWTTVPAAALFLLYVRPLADHHMLLLTVAYAISAGPSLALGIAAIRLPRARAGATAIVILFVLAGVYQEQRRLHRNDVAERSEFTWAAAVLRRVTPPDAIVVSDQPIIPFLARRAQPGPLVDTSNTRVVGGGLTADEAIHELERSQPEAVVVARKLASLPTVVALLEATYPNSVRCGDLTLYLRAETPAPPPCAP
jgi:4-amino-4-deoxy-L-arabinose transferase-like glycosyltransferase